MLDKYTPILNRNKRVSVKFPCFTVISIILFAVTPIVQIYFPNNFVVLHTHSL